MKPGMVFVVFLMGACTSGGGDDDTPAPSCDPGATFGTPTPVGGVNTGEDELAPRLSADELTVYFNRDVTGADHELYRATRATVADDFTGEVKLAGLNSNTGAEGSASTTADGSRMVLVSSRGGSMDLFLAALDDANEFAVTGQIVGTNTPLDEVTPFLSWGGGELFFASDRTDAQLDLFRATPSGNTFDDPVPVAELNTAAAELSPVLSEDGLDLYFSRDGDILRAHRGSVGGGFGTAEPVAELNTAQLDEPMWLSRGACRLYFHSDRPDGAHTDLYVAERPLL
jgi:hypothetical protein